LILRLQDAQIPTDVAKVGTFNEQQPVRFEFDVHGHTQNHWTWRSVDPESGSILKLSQTMFETLYACIRDAGETWLPVTYGTSRLTDTMHGRGMTAPAVMPLVQSASRQRSLLLMTTCRAVVTVVL